MTSDPLLPKMVICCSAYGCQEKFVKGGPFTFHRFPKDKQRKKQWEESIGRENFVATKFSKVCSRHFAADSFNRLKFGGTWLKANAVPTLFNFTENPLGKEGSTTAVKDEASTSKLQHSETPATGAKYRLGRFWSMYEDVGAPEKTAAVATSSKQSEPHLDSEPNFEPEIVIKEEPIDIDEEQLPSTSRTGDEFILPWTHGGTPSDHTPTLGVAFSVCKTEVADDQEDTAKRTSNGKPKASSKKKAAKGEVGQSEKKPRESEEDSGKDRPKDHFDAYGQYIAAKLRKLDWKSCAYVQKAIGDIMFEAEMGKYK